MVNQGKKIFWTIFWSVMIGVFFNGNRLWAASDMDMDSRRHEIDSLLEILPQSGSAGRYEILGRLSTIYMSISLDSSREYARLALQTAKQQNNTNQMAETYKRLGNIALYQGQYSHVVNYYDSSLSYYQQLNDSNGLAKVWNNLGVAYHNIGDFQASIDHHMNSLYAKIQLNDSLGIANSYNNIGSIYFEIHDLEKAYKYFQQALEISEKIDNSNTTQSILNNMGLISQDLGEQEQALNYFQKSLDIAEKDDNYTLMSDVYHNIGKSYMELGRYNESLQNYKKALELSDMLGIENSLTLNNIGQVYIELDYYNEAIMYLDKALKIAKSNNQFLNLSLIYNNRAVGFQRLKNYKEAYQNYIQFKFYDDSLKMQAFSNRISEISNQHELEKSREEVEKTRLEFENQQVKLGRRNLLLYFGGGAALAFLILAIVLFWFMRQRGIMNKILMQQNEEVLRSQEIIKKINTALTEKEEKLRSIFDVSPYAILVLDPDNTINDCNDTAASLFNAKNKRELLGKSVGKFLADTREKEKLFAQMESNKLSNSAFTLKRFDDATFEASITGRNILNGNGQVSAMVIVVNDITERLQFIESLKEAKFKAEESDRLKTAFLANMSHEIRTPMNAIVGFSNLLNEPDVDEVRRKEFLNHILQSSGQLLNLIDDIIDISKIEAGQLKFSKQLFNVNEVVRGTFNAFKETNSVSDLEYRLILPENSDNLQSNSDPVRLRQVLSNLLSNASKFTSKGFIELSYTINNLNKPARIEFCVRDSGIGIPADMHDMVFERFRQVDDSQNRKYGGTGLGLAISKKLVEMAGGSIWLESKKGKGSAFYFTLPYADQYSNIIPKLEPVISEKYNWKGKTLLVAEDENSNFELLKALLKQTGINLIWSHNGEEAVDVVKSKTPVDIILMDVRMPRMNGYEATRQIKKLQPKLPIISTTAYAMAEDEAKSKQAGCDKYLSKPIHAETLFPIIEAYLS